VVAVTGRGGVCAWGNNTHGLPGVEPRGGQTGRPVTLEGLTDPVGFEINLARAGHADQPVGRLVQLDLPGHRPARAHDGRSRQTAFSPEKALSRARPSGAYWTWVHFLSHGGLDQGAARRVWSPRSPRLLWPGIPATLSLAPRTHEPALARPSPRTPQHHGDTTVARTGSAASSMIISTSLGVSRASAPAVRRR
jgi:hypothetical protein